MSGDVQPRKRKDKKRKKDELSVEEPRGTAATFGEGDVFMHSQHEHGTGGHWCAKIIFFSLLAILITLVGLIILENRGLSELEANSVESRYSGVLEGWLEDVPDDDHHDEHTLELKHHDDDIGHENEFDDDVDDGHYNNGEHDDEQDHNEDDEDNEDGDDDEEEDDNEDDRDGEDDEDDDDNEDGHDDEDDNQDIDDSQEEYLEENDEDDDDKSLFSKYLKGDDDDQEDDDNDQEDDDDTQEYDAYDSGETQDPDGNNDDDDDDVKYEERSVEENYDDDDINEERSFEGNDDINEDDDDHLENRESNVDSHQIDRDDEDEDNDEEHEEQDELELEIERIEREASEEEPISTELPPLPEADEDDGDDDNGDGDDDKENEEDDNKDDHDEDSNEADNDDENDDEEEYLEQDLDEDDEPPIERITAPSGKPFDEVEEETSSEKPPDTLEEEEEYEKRQEELRREEEQASHKDGGNSAEDEWPGEPVDSFWQEELTTAERELRQGSWDAVARRAGVAGLRGSARAQLIRAQALDRSAEQRRDNALLSAAIAAYVQLLKMHERLNDKQLLLVAERALDRIRFRGNYMSAEPVYRLLIRRFPDEVVYRNNLTITYLMVNRADLATDVLRETLKRWPEDRVALAHYGFVLKTHHGKLEEAVEVLRKALDGDAGAANEPRFHYHLGDALLLLGRRDEADEVHRRGAQLGHFLSPMQRSLYNVPRLKSKPWWDIEETPYIHFGRELERSWRQILEEAKAAQSLYAQEKEGLRERGEWSQMDLWVRGREVEGRCKQAKVTCAVVSREVGARCSRGQVKFSAMEAGTHVRAHVGPTNCRLRVHLALSNTTDTYIRVGKEIRQWEVGKVLMFDDSFEHEVWHNGTGLRLVLIADVWHPDLTERERQTLAPI